jgi:hypothetical protein
VLLLLLLLSHSLASLMTWKTAVMDISYGGAKSGATIELLVLFLVAAVCH